MIKYGESENPEIRLTGFRVKVERRDPWVDVFLGFAAGEGTRFPDDLEDPSGLVICTTAGAIVQYIVQSEGCDSEYMFTPAEKEQIDRYLEESGILRRIAEETASANGAG